MANFWQQKFDYDFEWQFHFDFERELIMAKRPLSTNKQLSALVMGLKKKFGYVSVNYHEDTGCNVGFWSVPADAKSAALLKGDSFAGTAYVRLCNSPLFGGFVWGSLIRVETRGDIRAYFTLSMQKRDEAVKADQVYLKTFLEARKKAEAKEAARIAAATGRMAPQKKGK